MSRNINKNRADKYMSLALALAAKAKEKTYPNPMVGALIVKSGKIIGRGYHQKAGGNHAEIAAIKSAKQNLRGAEMYVTLEPCDHYGKTPPCTKTIIASGIKKVYIAMKDPNPLNNGAGIKKLKKAGISVEVGFCAREAARLNRKYIKFITKCLPYVTLKTAQSLDGKIAANDGSSKWVTSLEARKYAKKIRPDFDAIFVGINTVIKDDPFLLDEKRKGYDTVRLIADSSCKVPLNSNIIKTARKAPVIIGTTKKASKQKIEKLEKIKGVKVFLTKTKNNKVSLKDFLTKLARRQGIVNILAEGGGKLAGSLIDEGLVDEIMFFISPKLIGGKYSSVESAVVGNIASSIVLRNVKTRRFGPDIMITAEV